ncbi:unnamed protein product [Closterium sp. Yama58-4]|nr:unnamed protein product [Closterium sp. Yama58-4]
MRRAIMKRDLAARALGAVSPTLIFLVLAFAPLPLLAHPSHSLVAAPNGIPATSHPSSHVSHATVPQRRLLQAQPWRKQLDDTPGMSLFRARVDLAAADALAKPALGRKPRAEGGAGGAGGDGGAGGAKKRAGGGASGATEGDAEAASAKPRGRGKPKTLGAGGTGAGDMGSYNEPATPYVPPARPADEPRSADPAPITPAEPTPDPQPTLPEPAAPEPTLSAQPNVFAAAAAAAASGEPAAAVASPLQPLAEAGLSKRLVRSLRDLRAFQRINVSTAVVQLFAEMVDHSLAPWSKIPASSNGMGQSGMVSPSLLRSIAMRPRFMSCAGHVRVVEGGVYFRLGGFIDNAYRLRRFLQMVKTIQLAVTRFELSSIAAEFFLNVCDLPISYDNDVGGQRAVGFPLMSTRTVEGSLDIAVPDPLDLNENINLPPPPETEIPWEEKESRAILRGPVSSLPLEDVPNWRANPLIRLQRLSEARPDLLDAKLYGWSRELDLEVRKRMKADGVAMQGRAAVEEAVPARFKYGIVAGSAHHHQMCPILTTGAQVAIRQDSPYSEFFVPMLKPYVNFIPANRHFDNLVEKLRWAQNHDKHVRNMALAGKRVAKWACTKQGHALYWAILLIKYSRNAMEDPSLIRPPGKQLCRKQLSPAILALADPSTTGTSQPPALPTDWPPACSEEARAQVKQPACVFYCRQGLLKRAWVFPSCGGCHLTATRLHVRCTKPRRNLEPKFAPPLRSIPKTPLGIPIHPQSHQASLDFRVRFPLQICAACSARYPPPPPPRCLVMLSKAPARFASLASLALSPLLTTSRPFLAESPRRTFSLTVLAPLLPHTPPQVNSGSPRPSPQVIPHRAMVTSSAAEIPATQRAATVLAYEGPKRLADNLRLVTDKPVPSLGPNQVLVRMQLRPVNPADGLCAMGYYPGFAPANALPATLGLEGMGVVAALGESVAQSAPDLAVGRRVVPLLALGALEAGSGAWQEYVAVDAAHVAAVPAGVRDEDAAQLAVNPLTVLGMLNQLDVPKGEYLVQTQAGSTLGRMLIQVARARGIRTINVVRRAAQATELRALGGDEVICSTDESVLERVRAITGGRMAHAAVESVAGDLTGAVLSSVRPGGTVLLFGGASGATFSASIGDFIFRDVTLNGFWIGRFLKALSHEQRQAVVKEAFDLIASGTVTPFTGDRMDLSEFAAALKNQMAENRQGKILLSG